MSFWDRLINKINETVNQSRDYDDIERDSSRFCFVDVEVGISDKKIHDIGALRWDNAVMHSANKNDLISFIRNIDFVCGHNIVNHDAKYLFTDKTARFLLVDTLTISPLIFPERPYHHLVKDDKLMVEQINNPVNDCEKAQELLMDEVAQWAKLDPDVRKIYSSLLHCFEEFKGFLAFVHAERVPIEDIPALIHSTYFNKICHNADLESIVRNYPRELAYALALIGTSDFQSLTPGWVLYNYPNVENIVRLLRHTKCAQGCPYCNTDLDAHVNLKRIFGFNEFRTYEGEPLQENAVRAAIEHRSLLSIFPTGGGKSLTFQLPALMEGRSVHGLTVVISPLQSLMKDQVDNLADRGITNVVTINGMLDPISRAEAIRRVIDGEASLLYIAPEMLRSKTIEKILLSRNVVRFVIDEAHCFSSWGQDFRVDYLYIGTFINNYLKKKKCTQPIPVSCFTATAKQKVIQDICDYFKNTLSIDFQIFASSADRTNLRYSVIHVDSDDDKYQNLRALVSESDAPTIVYVSRTKRTYELAIHLSRDGFKAIPYHGRMDKAEKIANQDAFMNDRVRIIVATSAFGMGVDKKDVGMVIHYDISDSLENYVQEAGRAGRDPNLQARCYVLYCDTDLDKHFILLNQTKLSISEIQQVWKAIKELTRQRGHTSSSALEIARLAGWDDSVNDIETRVRTAIAALEQAGYLKRGHNVPHVYATGITVKNLDEARQRITESLLFENEDVEKAVRIIKSLLSQKYTTRGQEAQAESRIDYLSDILGIAKDDVISCVTRMRQEGILADSKDISAYLHDSGESQNKSKRLLDRFSRLERYILNYLTSETFNISYKQLNDNAQKEGIATSTEKDIRTLLYFLCVNGYARKSDVAASNIKISSCQNPDKIMRRFERRMIICQFAIGWLYKITQGIKEDNPNKEVRFSIVELYEDLKKSGSTMEISMTEVQLEDVEESLLYLSKIGALKLEGGFLVLYNTMDIHRIKDNRSRYKVEDYRMLDAFYRQKIQQIHIVGEFANLMVRDYNAALKYVHDYFHMDYRRFISAYFDENRRNEIERNVTPEKYNRIFGVLSEKQIEIISDKNSRCILVAAGPGSGKTRVLVHKLASLLQLEDVKHEQLLMLTFSRAAATEFKQRLLDLIGNAAHYVEIKTFHSYCFDLLGRIGSLDYAKDVVSKATEMVVNGEVEPNRIAKTVLVIDEAQDMSQEEYELVRALMTINEDMRVIAVGDDDQNIYEFRGSDSKFLNLLLKESGARLIELVQNYRSAPQIVNFSNALVKEVSVRMKTTPVISMTSKAGGVFLRHYSPKALMYRPLVDDLVKHRGEGSMCVLTQTNEEAALLVALLRKHGLNSKLLQSMDGLRFCNLAEMRMFLKIISSDSHSPIIPEDVWEKAKHRTCEAYASSSALPYLRQCICLFEKTNKTKYLSDFKNYIFESSTEDFCDLSGADVVVSTIHKAKGREFDDVYILLSQPQNIRDQELRRFYVAATRAKSRLYIHTDISFFETLPAQEHVMNRRHYDMPDEIMLQLSHKDVNLGFFKSRKHEILALRAGQRLRFFNNYLYEIGSDRPVAQLSQRMQTEVQGWIAKGYEVVSASIRFIVAWRPKDAPKDEEEHAVLLADLSLRKAVAKLP